MTSTITTHPLPPADFDPRAASALELRRYGLPQRPDPAVRPQLAALWDDVFSRSLTYLTPTFQPVHELLPGIEPAARPRPALTTVPNDHWSGTVVHAQPGQAFGWVTGRWNVPAVAAPRNESGTFYSFAWIGIDGVSDVTQIGTVQAVTADASGTQSTYCYAVFEWWPNNWQAISNFPVSFGDTMTGLICLLSPTEAYFSLVNLTTGMHAGFDFPAPANVSSLENQAEWVMERPGFPGASSDLPNFGEIYFDSAYGGYGLSFLADGGTDTAINMVQNGITVATTTVETPTLIKIAYTGG